MDNAELEDYIQHSRLRSIRAKKRMQREDFDKSLIRLHNELLALGERDRELGYEELNPPFQRGWKRFFVLRDDVARGKHAKFYRAILDKINTTKYSWRKDFKKKRKYRGKKMYVVRGQELETLRPCSFERKKFTQEEKAYFNIFVIRIPNSNKIEHFYRFSEPWRFVLKVMPNMITKVKIRDFNLERRRDEICSHLTRNDLWPRYHKVIYGGDKRRRGPLERYRNPLQNKSFADVLDEYLPVSEMQMSFETRNITGFFFFLLLMCLCLLIRRSIIFLT